MSAEEKKTPTQNTDEKKPEEKKPEEKTEPAAQPAAEAAAAEAAANANNNGEIAKPVSPEEEAKKQAEAQAKKRKEQLERETIVIQSPFPNNQGMLDEDGFFDVTIGFSGRKDVFRAHRSVLSKNSKTMNELFRGHKVDTRCTYDAEGNRVVWMLFGNEDISKEMLFRVIRFCYGAPLRVSPTNAANAIDVIFRMKIVGGEEIQNQIERHMVKVAEEDVESGTLMLSRCAGFELSDNGGFTRICTLLAKAVLTRENIEEYRDTVVDNCLMNLAPVYLDRAEFGNAHNEFALRKEYVVRHKGTLNDTELRNVICKCPFEKLNNSELVEMRKLRGVTKSVTEGILLDAYKAAMGECEARLAREQKRAEEAEAVMKQCKFIPFTPLCFV